MMMIASAITVAIDCDRSFVKQEQLASTVIHILSAATLSSINTCSPRAAPLCAQAATRSRLLLPLRPSMRPYRSFNTQSDPTLQYMYTTHFTTL